MQDPQQTHQDHDTRSLPLWYQRLSVGPLGPMALCVIALGFVALLISGRLRMLYPMPRTVIASPQTQEPPRPISPKPPAADKAIHGGTIRPSTGETKPHPVNINNAAEQPAAPGHAPSPATLPPETGEFKTPPQR